MFVQERRFFRNAVQIDVNEPIGVPGSLFVEVRGKDSHPHKMGSKPKLLGGRRSICIFVEIRRGAALIMNPTRVFSRSCYKQAGHRITIAKKRILKTRWK
jgi:hypothetical protein